MSEFCHYRDWDAEGVQYGRWCGAPAEFIVWGKLFPPDALGPRCYDHAAKQIGHRAVEDSCYAVYHIPKERTETDEDPVEWTPFDGTPEP